MSAVRLVVKTGAYGHSWFIIRYVQAMRSGYEPVSDRILPILKKILEIRALYF